jgi:hypothetical protein
VTEEHAILGDATLNCHAEARPYAHGRSVAISVFNSSASHIASLLVLCSRECPHFLTITTESDSDLERRALSAFLAGHLSLDLGRLIDSSQQIRVAGRVDYPGQVIVELHPPNSSSDPGAHLPEAERNSS